MEIQTTNKAAQTLNRQGQIITLDGLNLQSAKLNNIEKRIIDNRINKAAISEIPEQESKILADLAIFKIAAISGFSLPTSSEFCDILNEEFLMLLKEYGYSNFTFDEIVDAFRINAVGGYRFSGGHELARVDTYGGFFNMNFAGKVLANYLSIRKSLDSRICNDENITIKDIIKKYDNYKK